MAVFIVAGKNWVADMHRKLNEKVRRPKNPVNIMVFFIRAKICIKSVMK